MGGTIIVYISNGHKNQRCVAFKLSMYLPENAANSVLKTLKIKNSWVSMSPNPHLESPTLGTYSACLCFITLGLPLRAMDYQGITNWVIAEDFLIIVEDISKVIPLPPMPLI